MNYIAAATTLGRQRLKLAADLAVGVSRGVGIVVGLSGGQQASYVADGGVEVPGGGSKLGR